MILETDRLVLRQWEKDDYLDLHEIVSDKRVAMYRGCEANKDIERSKRIIETYMKFNRSFAIVLKDENKVIGSIGMDDMVTEENLMKGNRKYFGYALNYNYWGNGYMPEASKGFIEYLFDKLNVYAVWSSHYDYNHNSRRVLEKCGFKYEFNKDGELFYSLHKTSDKE